MVDNCDINEPLQGETSQYHSVFGHIVYPICIFFDNLLLSVFLSGYSKLLSSCRSVTVSIVVGAFLSLSEPIGGVIFGITFWKISKLVSYERNIRTYMFISGWGIFLIFTANQATTLIVNPYPPFGLVTITVLNMAAFLMLIGIYNSATLVSTNNELRKFIHKQAFESRLLSLIGHAEMEKEIQKTITKITQDKTMLEEDTEEQIELDENELKKYIDIVVRESNKKHENIKRP
jgi:hypothetical protein